MDCFGALNSKDYFLQGDGVHNFHVHKYYYATFLWKMLGIYFYLESLSTLVKNYLALKMMELTTPMESSLS